MQTITDYAQPPKNKSEYLASNEKSYTLGQIKLSHSDAIGNYSFSIIWIQITMLEASLTIK